MLKQIDDEILEMTKAEVTARKALVAEYEAAAAAQIAKAAERTAILARLGISQAEFDLLVS